nr:hypothetical protein [Micromonospora sp. DSM 115978]
MTTDTGSSALSVRIRTLGVMTSSAVRSPNSNERCTSDAVPAGSIPLAAERPTSDNSSSGERADASSSGGSTFTQRR